MLKRLPELSPDANLDPETRLLHELLCEMRRQGIEKRILSAIWAAYESAMKAVCDRPLERSENERLLQLVQNEILFEHLWNRDEEGMAGNMPRPESVGIDTRLLREVLQDMRWQDIHEDVPFYVWDAYERAIEAVCSTPLEPVDRERLLRLVQNEILSGLIGYEDTKTWYDVRVIPTRQALQSDDPVASFPFELLRFTGAEACSAFEKLREKGKTEGFTAVLIADSLDGRSPWDSMMPSVNPDSVLDRAEAIRAKEWLSKRIEKWFSEKAGREYNVELGEWSDEQCSEEFGLLAMMDLSGQPKESVYIAQIPTTSSWKVPAYLGWGGWNECPSPEEQVAISKYWHDLYGAEIAAVTSDAIELIVEKPPVNREDAEKLAREQFVYCTDIVFQGTETLRALASALINGRSWGFWWD
jgi:hypothetical protein